ncbi:caveolin-2 isoform X2 [Salmo salar]|uniref:Caveolin n=1 Tax=Salmo salar TaxID=8030 RepID=A0A1S3P6Z2_SALSA|nr:caveolin-2 isoform X2 [Salmo salar]
MMRKTDPVETKIDLGDTDDEDLDADLYEDHEEPQLLWKAELGDRMDEEEPVSPLVDLSDTKPLLNERDPRGVNECLKVSFEDVIAEPASVRSGDRVWIWSNALFEVTRVWIYRIVTVLLAVPVSIITGLIFAILSFLHIWFFSPFVHHILRRVRRIT